METEKLKVQESSENPNQPNQLAILLHVVFEQTESGKKLLKLLKERYVSDKYQAGVFPISPQVYQQFGGCIEAYCGFKAGHANVIFQIEELIEQYDQMEKANQAKSKE